MRRAIVCLSLIFCGVVALVADAAAQTPPRIPNRPAATLLLPYFEVDLDNPLGVTTLFSVNNASASAAVAHVTFWSDLGIPVFAYDIYLTGYDVQTINIRDMIVNGKVPRTADDGADVADTANPNDGVSNQGPLSQDINFPGSSGPCIVPLPDVPAIYLPYLRSALTGGPSSFHGGQCVARNLGTPNIARGYVTVDSVTQCNLLFPSSPGYFPGGVADTRNILYGDYLLIDPSRDRLHGDTLVAVATDSPSSPPDPYFAPGANTFYGRFTGFSATDRREPLSTNYAARYVSQKDFKTPDKARRRPFLPPPGTELIVWRDPKVASTNAFACGSTPTWYPLSQEQIRAFDEQEGTEEPGLGTTPFPAATQRVPLGGSELPVSFSSGWLFLNLNTVVPGAVGQTDPASAQAWVTVLQNVQQGPNGGRYEVGSSAIRLDSGRAAQHLFIP